MTVLERTTTRALPLLNRGAELAPAAQACCGLCRGCMTTNIATAIAAAAVGLAGMVRRTFRRG
jgi:hypothetical protein